MALSAPPAPVGAVAHLAVAGLGPLRVEIDGRPIPFRAGRRERGVFQYLLLHRRRPVPREELTEVFWPGSSPSDARNNLNVSVWGLRNRLREPLGGRSVCVFEDGAYRLDPSLAIRVDAEEMERLAAAARVRRRAGDIEGAAAHLRSGVALYEGDLFEDDRYEAWIDPFRRGLAVEPEREDLHRLLMRCYAQAGQRSLAVRQLGLCAKAMRRSLGADPGAETVALADRIRRGDVPSTEAAEAWHA